MKLFLKWFVVGLIVSIVLVLGMAMSIELQKSGDSNIGVVFTSHLYEAFGLVPLIVTMTFGLALIVPTATICLVGFFVEKRIRRNRSISGAISS